MEGLTPQGQELTQEYVELLLERDQLRKETGIYQMMYLHFFGEEVTAVFEEKIACIRCKKAITFCQQALNRGKTPDRIAMQEYLQKEMEEYRLQLEKMRADCEATRSLHTSPEHVVKKVKRLYRELAKLLHPDWNPRTNESPLLQELWQRVMIAYHANALEELTELDIQVRFVLQQMGLGNEEIQIPDIAEKLDELRAEIYRIQTTDPYLYKFLLDDEEAVADKHTELKQELESYRSYHKKLELALQMLLAQEGGSV